MTPNEASEAYEDLLKSLHDYDLEWVVDQVRQHVQEGKLVDIENIDESPRTPGEYRIPASVSKTRQPKMGLTTEPYDAHERLSIALNAIEAIAIQTTELQNGLADFFELGKDGGAVVRFEPDELDRPESRAMGRPSKIRTENSEKLR